MYFRATIIYTTTTKQVTTNYIIYLKLHHVKQFIFDCWSFIFSLEDNMYSLADCLYMTKTFAHPTYSKACKLPSKAPVNVVFHDPCKCFVIPD